MWSYFIKLCRRGQHSHSITVTRLKGIMWELHPWYFKGGADQLSPSSPAPAAPSTGSSSSAAPAVPASSAVAAPSDYNLKSRGGWS